MSKNTKVIALAMLLVGIIVGAAGAQIERTTRTRVLVTSLFPVNAGQHVNFHVTFHDQRGALPARVVLELRDESGAVVITDTAVLQPGQSTTLRALGPGLFSAHAHVQDPVLTLSSPDRVVVGTVALIDDLTTEQKFVCSVNEGVSSGRAID